MNHIFTLKARIILFSLLICQLGLKAQTTAAKNDTAAKRADTSYALKVDTSLSVKAGSTLVIKSDTMMVINPDAALISKTADAIARKADDLSGVNKGIYTGRDTSVAKTTGTVAMKTADVALVTAPAASPAKIADAPSITKPDSAAKITPPVTAAVPDAGIAKSGTDNALKEDTNYTEKDRKIKADALAAANLKKDSAAVAQKVDNKPAADPAVKADAPVVTANNTTAPKADSTAALKPDTTIKKADTTLAKKSDTTLTKRSDTTLVQKADTSEIHYIKAQSAFLEVGGAGLAISANYDSRFKKERSGWGYRVGVGFFTSGGNTVESIPFQINYLIGEHSHMLELGAGTTFLNSTGSNVGSSKWEFDKVTGFIATASIGYRFQPAAKGLMFRLAFVPILYDEGLIPAGGVSIGYTFK